MAASVGKPISAFFSHLMYDFAMELRNGNVFMEVAIGKCLPHVLPIVRRLCLVFSEKSYF